MDRIEVAYQSGVAEAERDISAGQLRLRYGASGAWGQDLAETLLSRFGVELVVLSCLTDAESLSFEAGYNRTVEAHIDGVWGPGSVAAVHEEVHAAAKRHTMRGRRRKAALREALQRTASGPSTLSFRVGWHALRYSEGRAELRKPCTPFGVPQGVPPDALGPHQQ